MDETTLMQDIVQKIFVTTQDTKAKHIRVVNLSVSDAQIDSDKLTRAFETLTFTTMAQGARLHVRRDENVSQYPIVDPIVFGKTTSPVRLDSLELD